MNKLYVGNLSPSVTVEDLKELFGERKLPVAEQVLLKSGYAFVDFPDQNSAIKAIETLSGKCAFDKYTGDAAVTHGVNMGLKDNRPELRGKVKYQLFVFCALRSHPCAIGVFR